MGKNGVFYTHFVRGLISELGSHISLFFGMTPYKAHTNGELR